MNKIAFLMPIYPRHYKYAYEFIGSFKKFNIEQQADLWFVFTTEEDKNKFINYDRYIILSKEFQDAPDRCLINIKKFYGLIQLKSLYDYIIVLDAESKIIKNINLKEMCDAFYRKKLLYGNNTLHYTSGVIKAVSRYFKYNPRLNTINTDLYLWFNQPCIYKCSFLDDFFTITGIYKSLKDIPALAFDYYIYMYFLLLYRDFQIFDLRCTAVWSIIEGTRFTPMDDTYKKVNFYLANPALLNELDNPNLFLLIKRDKKKLKLAIQLFGHLRTFKYTFENFEKKLLLPNILGTYEIDIFIHTWDKYDHSTINYRNNTSLIVPNQNLTDDDISLVHKLYKPKSFKIDKQLDCIGDKIINEKIYNVPRQLKGCLNNAYTIYSVNELRNEYEKYNNVKYDWVLTTRSDILFINPFDLYYIFECYEKFDFSIPKNGIFCAFNPFGRNNKIDDPRFLTGSDLIYLATPENMNKATSLYNDFYNNIDIENFYCMEVWWAEYWKKQGLSICPINYRPGRDFEVVRNYHHFKMIKKYCFISKLMRRAKRFLRFFMCYN